MPTLFSPRIAGKWTETLLSLRSAWLMGYSTAMYSPHCELLIDHAWEEVADSLRRHLGREMYIQYVREHPNFLNSLTS